MTENETKKNISKTKSIIKDNEKIYRFPFHGKSKYLIDKLYIIGYDSVTINKYFSERANNKLKFDDPDCIDTSSKNQRSKLYLSKIPQSNAKKINPALERIETFTIPEKPSLVNEISNDYNKKVLDEDITINMVFPNIPIFYFVKESKRQLSPSKNTFKKRRNTDFYTIKYEMKNGIRTNDIFEELKEIIKGKKYCMIFSSNPQIDKNNKKSINGFCYINYCKYKEKKIMDDYLCTIYIPIGLCFISEFPYYQSYYKLAEQIFLLFNSKRIEVPIEIMLYNLINRTLSPINGDIDLCIEPVIFHNNIISQNSNSISNKNDISDINTKESNNKDGNTNAKNEKEVSVFVNDFLIIEKNNSENARDDGSIDNNNNVVKEEKESNSSKLLVHVQKKIETNLDIRSSYKKTSVIKDTNLQKILNTKALGGESHYLKNLFEQIKFPFLQGYPLMQYNLPRILFNNFSIFKYIFLFINSFLEKDILIFSEDIEVLSFAINTFHNLNYPLNDNAYYNINGCISYNNYIRGNCNFISTAMNSIKGINSSLQLNYLSNNDKKVHEQIIYDLDRRVFL